MDDDRKKGHRGKPPRAAGASRSGKSSDGGKPVRRHGKQRPYGKAGEASARREDGAARPRTRPEGRESAPGTGRDSGSPTPRAGRRFAPGAADSGAGEQKYWGKRPGRREREEQKRPPSPGGRGFSKPGQPPRAARGPAPDRHDSRDEPTVPPERIAKRLARAGISSRRDAESLIAMGRVKVNGAVLTSPAHNVTAADRIEVDGVEIPPIERTRLFLFHKPAGVVTTNRDPEGRRTVFDVLPDSLPRLMTVGRLDINTEGLLLLTNDGGLARVMELPATGWLRRYRVRVHGKVDEARLAGLKDGIAVDGVFYGSIEASLEREQGTNAWLTIGLREGKNREVKNILAALGLEVARLIRVSYGPFQLGELESGQIVEIRGRTLRDQLGERLIEESGANFDAGIAKPFSNKPVRRGEERGAPVEPRPARRPRELSVGEGGLVRGFRRDRERAREDILDRLTTSPDANHPASKERSGRAGPARGKPGRPGKRADRDDAPPASPRSSNVWMAPGARPQAKKPSERAAERRDGPPPRKGPRGAGPSRGGRPRRG